MFFLLYSAWTLFADDVSHELKQHKPPGPPAWFQQANIDRQNLVKQSAERIKIFLEDKIVLDPQLPKKLNSSSCLDRALWQLATDKAEIKEGGLIMTGGHIVASRHRFLYPLDSEVISLEVKIRKRNDADHVSVFVEAKLKSGKTKEIFSANYSSNNCLGHSFDLLQWIELANRRKSDQNGKSPKSRSSTAG